MSSSPQTAPTRASRAAPGQWRRDRALARARAQAGSSASRSQIENLSHTLTDAIVRFEPLDGAPKTLRITPDDPVDHDPDKQPWTDVAAPIFVLGVEHILLGFDHLMFVLALLLLVRDCEALVGAITAFTVAHSLTLAGTTFGWIKLPSAPVEATIALSIMFVAVEIMRVQGRPRPASRRKLPWLASFAFGLLHGFGFAGALREIGIPEDAAPLALLFFNLGVEARPAHLHRRRAGRRRAVAPRFAATTAWSVGRDGLRDRRDRRVLVH